MVADQNKQNETNSYVWRCRGPVWARGEALLEALLTAFCREDITHRTRFILNRCHSPFNGGDSRGCEPPSSSIAVCGVPILYELGPERGWGSGLPDI